MAVRARWSLKSAFRSRRGCSRSIERPTGWLANFRNCRSTGGPGQGEHGLEAVGQIAGRRDEAQQRPQPGAPVPPRFRAQPRHRVRLGARGGVAREELRGVRFPHRPEARRTRGRRALQLRSRAMGRASHQSSMASRRTRPITAIATAAINARIPTTATSVGRRELGAASRKTTPMTARAPMATRNRVVDSMEEISPSTRLGATASATPATQIRMPNRATRSVITHGG